jgi:error-prone DNA polymerase
MEDVVRAAGLHEPQVEALATAGAFGSLGLDRRSALWGAGAVAQSRADRLPGVVVGASVPALPGMDAMEETIADLWSTSVTTSRYPTEFVRERLDELGAVAASGLHGVAHGERVLVGGVVTHRQRPATAQGTIFINLEDETGLVNVICSKGAWAHYRRAARSAPALLVRGTLEKVDGVINVVADKITELSLTAGRVTPKSRDFR